MEKLMRLPLTSAQQQVYEFIQKYAAKNGYPPRYCDIQSHLGISNPGSVHKAIKSLERKGWLLRQKGMHRGILIEQKGTDL